MNPKWITSLLAMSLWLGPTPAATAGQSTAQMNVSLTVGSPSVTVSVTPMNFGSLGGQGTATGTSTITVNAPQGTPYTVLMNRGSNAGFAGSDPTKRYVSALQVTPTPPPIPYNLYTDLNHTVIWGDGGLTIPGSGVPGNGAGVNQTLTVFGLTGAQPTVPPAGTYSDVVTVTVTF